MKAISLFMWNYQSDFRYEIMDLMNGVLKELGILEVEAECFLVGARIPDRPNSNDVCVEPEDGKWPVGLFDELLEMIGAEVECHPLQNMHYGDELSTRDKPENIRQDSTRRAIQKTLNTYDMKHNVCSFVGKPVRVSDYYVTPVLQLPSELFERFRPLREPISDDCVTVHLHPSLIHAAACEVLAEAYDELLRPDPGRGFIGRFRFPVEITRRAAASFMRTLKLAIRDGNFGNPNIFDYFNAISSLMYEGTEGTGRLLLANPDNESIDMCINLAKPVPFREFRWSRKVLEMASPEVALIADCKKIFGLGDIATGIDPWMDQNIFQIEFLDHCHWRLSCGGEVMLVSKYGIPSLPKEKFSRDRLLDIYGRLFPRAREKDTLHFFSLFEAATCQRHGSMLVVAEDAESEADRLQDQGTKIEPTKLTPDLYSQVSGIDGSIIIDPYGICYAIGVILDGSAQLECTPSRGARYNSGIRYVRATGISRLAIIISDDQTVDVIPELRPRVKQSTIEKNVAEIETATRDNYHQAINWLDRHRFYLNQEQCNRVNKAIERIQEETREVGGIMVKRAKFSPHPDLNDSYFESE